MGGGYRRAFRPGRARSRAARRRPLPAGGAQGAVGLLARQVGPVGQERPRLLLGLGARVGGGGRGGAVAAPGRRRSRRCASRARWASADQCTSRPQPMRSGGKGSSAAKVSRRRAVTGPISTNRVWRPSAERTAAGDRARRRASGARWAGWASVEAQSARRRPGSGRGSRVAARRRRRASSSQSTPSSGAVCISASRFSNLPRSPGGATARSTWWRLAQQLAPLGVDDRPALVAHDLQHEHVAARRAAGQQAQARAGG